jgi:hypothetical protein
MGKGRASVFADTDDAAIDISEFAPKPAAAPAPTQAQVKTVSEAVNFPRRGTAKPSVADHAGPLSLVLANLTSGITLSDRNGTTVCFAPVGSPYVNLDLPANNELGAGKSTEVSLLFKGSANTTITFTSKVAGPGAR